jgi:hypothetical protein
VSQDEGRRMVNELMDFWKALKEKAQISFKDFEQIETILFRVHASIDDLKRSRDKWKARAILAEKQLKEKSI